MGYAPLPREASNALPAFGEAGVQPRIPAGNTGGGQWSSGGSPSGRVRVAQAERGTRNDAGETQIAQARGGRTRTRPRIGENWEATPAEEARLAVAEGWAHESIRRAQVLDPDWHPTPSFVESAEGAIARAEGEAREAEARLAELARDAIPSTNPEWGENRLRKELYDRGYLFDEETRAPGQLFVNPTTGEEVRIMERPAKTYRAGPPQKYLYERYYRYRKARDQKFGSAIPIPDKNNAKDNE